VIKKSLAVVTTVVGLLSLTIAAAPSQAATPTPYPVTISNYGSSMTFTKSPSRIISLSPTATEMLFAINAGSKVVAVDNQSNYPANAPKTSLSGYTPNLESILSYKPDLVVVSYDPGDLVSSLRNTGVKVLVQDAANTLNDSYSQILQLGSITGRVVSAKAVVSNMKSKIAAALASLPNRNSRLTVYHELDDTYYSVTSSTFVGQLYSMAGLVNIADAADGAEWGYPQLSSEYIIAKNPSMIFLADTGCCNQSRTTVNSRPGFGKLSAVKRNHIYILSDDIASRWGPRTASLFEAIVWAVKNFLRTNH
jgi:iron complex transport system substrate-binding protein